MGDKLDTPIYLVKEKKTEIRKSAEEQIYQLFLDSPLDKFPAQHEVVIDGKIHRFDSGDGRNKENGWYVFSRDGVCVHGSFGCWKRDFTFNFKEDIGRNLSNDEIQAIELRRAAIEGEKAALRAQQADIAKSNAAKIWESCEPVTNHPYLIKKKIKSHGLRVTAGDDRLVIPMYDSNLELAGLQYIYPNSEKRFLGSQSKKIHCLGDPENGNIAYLAEGFSTGATIHEQTNKPVFIGFNAGNLVSASRIIKSHYPELKIINIADNDKAGLKQIDALDVEGIDSILIPKEGQDANDFVNGGGDLCALLDFEKPKNPMGLASLKNLKKNKKPIRWLIKNWLQRKALIMVHGPSGAGKSYCVLDWCMRLATEGFDEWAGSTVKSANVIYLAGEGNEGLVIRAEAWETRFNSDNDGSDPTIWISDRGCALNTNDGFGDVIDSIESTEIVPDLIVVDTLHRFLDGDENSARDAKTMIDACDRLKNEYGCSVILVHHTGVSSEAQGRARGSSSWKGALDGEISIAPLSDGKIQLIQRKNKELGKKIEPVVMEFDSVPIPDFYDEDGEQVCSSVLTVSDEVVEQKPAKKESKRDIDFRWIEQACVQYGDMIDDKFYISGSALRDYLRETGAFKESTIKQKTKPSFKTGLIYPYINDGSLEAFERGWRITDNVINSRIALLKGNN